MNHLLFASLGLVMIGLVATGAISWFTLRRLADPMERSEACRWLALFGLSICTLCGLAPRGDTHQHWLLLLPLAGTWATLVVLHRIVERAGNHAARPVSRDNEAA